MKRDMDLIRELLLKLESYPVRPSAIAILQPDDDRIAVEGHDAESIALHLDLIREAGLIDTGDFRSGRGISFRRLSWEGYDFLDIIRDSEVWAKTKQGADAVKSWSLETLKELGNGLIKKQIEEFTGVKIG